METLNKYAKLQTREHPQESCFKLLLLLLQFNIFRSNRNGYCVFIHENELYYQ